MSSIIFYYILIFLICFSFSSLIFIFFVVKGGFNKKCLIYDNSAITILSFIIIFALFAIFNLSLSWLIIITPLIVFSLFVLLYFYRFYRNPRRRITASPNEFVSPADGRVIYIKNIEPNQIPISIKKHRLAKIEEITKTDLLKEPCYLIGIAMTLFDVHINRAPIKGKVIFVKHTPGEFMGLNKPESTFRNERNTIVIKGDNGVLVGVVQIAASIVRRCIVSVKDGESVEHGGIIGKIRWGSQADLIIPRNTEILVREGDQVYAGKTIIGRLIDEK